MVLIGKFEIEIWMMLALCSFLHNEERSIDEMKNESAHHCTNIQMNLSVEIYFWKLP